jgi:hypothetical protein
MRHGLTQNSDDGLTLGGKGKRAFPDDASRKEWDRGQAEKGPEHRAWTR